MLVHCGVLVEFVVCIICDDYSCLLCIARFPALLQRLVRLIIHAVCRRVLVSVFI